ncbi:hypothetical protein Q1695_007563 [Nippostrongylus brasiliensis]|nr:hypothetical protein Q1695_007563 [Nippostrongylus brasiliensis]
MDWYPFSESEKEQLLRSWKAIESQKQAIGCDIYEMIFNQVFEGAVMSLDNLPALDPILDNLGRRHGKLEVNGKFRTYYWSTFLECSICILRKTLTSCRKFPLKEIDSAIILWRYLLRDVMKKIKNGYNADINNRMTSMAMEDTRSFSLPSIRKQSYTSDVSEL